MLWPSGSMYSQGNVQGMRPMPVVPSSPGYQKQGFQNMGNGVRMVPAPGWGQGPRSPMSQSFQQQRMMPPGRNFQQSAASFSSGGRGYASYPTTSTRALQTNSGSQPFLSAMGTPGAARHASRAYIPTTSKGGCENQECAEEECDPEECGDENRPPREGELICGLDRRPCLPLTLFSTTLLGAVCLLSIQLPFTDMPLWCLIFMYIFWVAFYAVTIAALVYCALCDPGMIRTPGEEDKLPARAHKSWLYDRPLRRYDHYCRWLTNAIALLNHREFVIVMIGLVTIGVMGAILDIIVIIVQSVDKGPWWAVTMTALHLAYSIAIVVLATPILRIHIGLISRNELAAEWKRNEFYVIEQKSGDVIPVNELSDDEFNELFDNFCYDSARNPFDYGLRTNCWNFWCIPRWVPGQLGEF